MSLAGPAYPWRLGLEALTAKTHARGLMINDLFEIGEGWRANRTDGRLLYEFGEDANLASALKVPPGRAAKGRRP